MPSVHQNQLPLDQNLCERPAVCDPPAAPPRLRRRIGRLRALHEEIFDCAFADAPPPGPPPPASVADVSPVDPLSFDAIAALLSRTRPGAFGCADGEARGVDALDDSSYTVV